LIKAAGGYFCRWDEELNCVNDALLSCSDNNTIQKSCSEISSIIPGGCYVNDNNNCGPLPQLCSSFTSSNTCWRNKAIEGFCYYNSSSGNCVHLNEDYICSDIKVIFYYF
jgi:hypothetical protein